MRRETELREVGASFEEYPGFWYEIETYDRIRFLNQVQDLAETKAMQSVWT